MRGDALLTGIPRLVTNGFLGCFWSRWTLQPSYGKNTGRKLLTSLLVLQSRLASRCRFKTFTGSNRLSNFRNDVAFAPEERRETAPAQTIPDFMKGVSVSFCEPPEKRLVGEHPKVKRQENAIAVLNRATAIIPMTAGEEYAAPSLVRHYGAA